MSRSALRADIAAGAILPDLRKDPVTRMQLIRYAEASGDPNKIHLDDQAARQAGLDGVIAHGMLSMAFLGEYLCWLGDPASVRRLAVRFVAMVRPGDVLTCRGRFTPDQSTPATWWVTSRAGLRLTTRIIRACPVDLCRRERPPAGWIARRRRSP